MSGHPLDDPARSALEGADARFAERHGGALRYRPEFSVFGTGPWQDLEALAGPGGLVVYAGAPAAPPAAWQSVPAISGFQLTGEAFEPRTDPEVVDLDATHADAMADLVERTRPGPWAPRTHELGGYRGILVDGILAAMAGERMHPEGWTEISAVCTDPAHRGRGLATRVMRAVAAGIVERGEVPFLHVAGNNTGAIALYERLGFRTRRPIDFVIAVAPTLET
ncbi:GNAT family N-acetyltransferase [Pseudolysinimonas sp.]|uniref:GNAT family N-acetyltransferase n=1 Tax=Pseudolysinimonas sp. TaxID=2680009 RepID=UPI003F80DFB4